ncbi:MAG TPA: MBL fold metallo-hydrolase [Burkholderiales bacterium]|nr:MBL fold metallo-hydrolase [Burkholderiales bacterium]
MRVKFWGTRGSIATPGPATNIYGGNTSCVELRCAEELLIFDAGTGLRPLGLELMAEFGERPFTVHLFISHTHWDHIQGFPFFIPAYAPQATIHVYGSTGQGRPLEKILRGQMDSDYFPVALGDTRARLHMHEFKGKPFQIGEAAVTAMYLNHPGMTLGYRVSHGGKSFVYATDNEPYRHTLEHLGGRAEEGRDFGRGLDAEFVRFIHGADLYIGEAQYTDEEYPKRIGWGHSSISATVNVALEAQVRALALFHHDPLHDDEAVASMAQTAHHLIQQRGSNIQCFAAREGQVLEL